MFVVLIGSVVNVVVIGMGVVCVLCFCDVLCVFDCCDLVMVVVLVGVLDLFDDIVLFMWVEVVVKLVWYGGFVCFELLMLNVYGVLNVVELLVILVQK